MTDGFKRHLAQAIAEGARRYLENTPLKNDPSVR
jgi:hypothetical protein